MEIENETMWMRKANCRGRSSDQFYPDQGGNIQQSTFKICQECSVIEECLDYALRHQERHGVWGGKSERERRKIVRGRLLQPNLITSNYTPEWKTRRPS